MPSEKYELIKPVSDTLRFKLKKEETKNKFVLGSLISSIVVCLTNLNEPKECIGWCNYTLAKKII